MPTPAEPKASPFGLLAGSSRRLLVARRCFRFMSRASLAQDGCTLVNVHVEAGMQK
jgi:hypothetical protein